MKVTIGTPKPSEFPGYETLPITLSKGGKSQNMEFLLSKDGKTLVRVSKIDLTKDPYEETIKKIDVAGRPVRGNPNAKVTIVNFDDFECPFCSRMHSTLMGEILPQYGDKIRIIYKDYPLSIHPWAQHAANNANCLAKENGLGYWDFADYVHANQRAISGTQKDVQNSINELDHLTMDIGKKYGADPARLEACVKAQADGMVRASMAEGDSLGVNATPTVFINGQRLEGAVDADEVKAALNQQLLAAGVQLPTAATPQKQSPGISSGRCPEWSPKFDQIDDPAVVQSLQAQRQQGWDNVIQAGVRQGQSLQQQIASGEQGLATLRAHYQDDERIWMQNDGGSAKPVVTTLDCTQYAQEGRAHMQVVCDQHLTVNEILMFEGITDILRCRIGATSSGSGSSGVAQQGNPSVLANTQSQQSHPSQSQATSPTNNSGGGNQSAQLHNECITRDPEPWSIGDKKTVAVLKLRNICSIDLYVQFCHKSPSDPCWKCEGFPVDQGESATGSGYPAGCTTTNCSEVQISYNASALSDPVGCPPQKPLQAAICMTPGADSGFFLRLFQRTLLGVLGFVRS